jgi:sec-independent protein translocase protein TatC
VAQGVFSRFQGVFSRFWPIRRPQPASAEPDEHMRSIGEHLQDLRRVLIVSMSAWLVATIACAVLTQKIIAILIIPLKEVLAGHHTLVKGPIIYSPTDFFTIPFKVAMVGGFVLSLPIILWQLWTFVSPGLRKEERRFAGPFVASAIVLFAAGAGLAYFLMTIWLSLLMAFIGSNATYFPDLNDYLSFLLTGMLAFGVTFELPIVVVLLGLVGIVSSGWLRRRRKMVWVIIIIVANLATPGVDPFTPMLLATPLIALYELSTFVLAKVFHR